MKLSLAGRYVVFAIVATAINFAAQSLSLSAYRGPSHLAVSLLCGTAMGFFVKYALDKYFIFFDRHGSASREVGKIILYGLTAVVTTGIFWSLELGFWALWQSSLSKYMGGALGLGLGYYLKYRLDRRFVFVEGTL